MSACLRTLVASLCLCFTCLPAKAKDPPDYTTALPHSRLPTISIMLGVATWRPT